ncbi:MAG: hypothetical protein V3W31_08260 [Thermodesulfobacteriota bacterium]
MKNEALLALLEESAEKLSIKLDYDDLRKGEVNTPGGTFLLRGERHILIHRYLSAGEKVDVLIGLLSGFDTEGVHLPPEVRERLEAARESKKEAEKAARGRD